MKNACEHVFCMSTLIQVRNVPEDLHRRVKARAALQGMSMSEYVLRELERAMECPTLEELRARIKALPPVELSTSAAELIREERDRR